MRIIGDMGTARWPKGTRALVLLFAEVSASVDVPDEMHIVPMGKWQHPVYGEMEIIPALSNQPPERRNETAGRLR